jgi:hypothetical protein
MTREEAISILRQYIKTMEFAQERAKEILERIKAGDEAAIGEFSDLFAKR